MLLTLFLLTTADLSYCAFMAGSWGGTQNGTLSEEHWTAPAGGIMLGMHRDIKGDRSSFEFMRIEQRGEDLVLVAQPRGGTATEFTYTGGDSQMVVFENPEHDYPKRITYLLDSDGNLVAKIDGGPHSRAPERSWIWQPRNLKQ